MPPHSLLPTTRLSRRAQRHVRLPHFVVCVSAPLIGAGTADAQVCPGENTAQHFTGGGSVACACFVPGEEVGAVFELPAETFPIEIIRIGIGWGSQFGGQGQTLEQAIHVYEGGLPDPGTPVFTLPGPVLTDGAINEFDIDVLDVFVDTSPFTITLEFMNPTLGDPFAPTAVHDGNGCTPDLNVIYAIPGGWLDPCGEGVTGDWIFTVTYRCEEVVGVETVSSVPLSRVSFARPNPFAVATEIGFSLAHAGRARVVVYDVHGRALTTLADGHLDAGEHVARWSGVDATGRSAPAGVYFIELRTGDVTHTRKIVRQEG